MRKKYRFDLENT